MSYKSSPFYQPKQDTGWGLIFRLNGLFDAIERDVENGNMDRWNLHLDRIFINILYKNPEETIKDEKGKVTDIKFSALDIEIFTKINRMIDDVKTAMYNPKTFLKMKSQERIAKVNELRREYYKLLFKKDVWLRKKMFKLDLYLKQVEHDPRKAIYGG